MTPFTIIATALYLIAAALVVYSDRRRIDLAVPILLTLVAAVAAHVLSTY
jgi:hypothetical protein